MSNDNIISKAYKKLKSMVYYDRNQRILNNNIAEFEFEHGNLDEYLTLICDKYNKPDEFKEYLDTLLYDDGGIDYLIMPKKIKSNIADSKEKNDFSVVVNNDIDIDFDLLEYQFFSNFSVEISLMGVLWIMLIGKSIDNSLSEFCYGNRLKMDSIDENTNFLFKPYFEQFESWQNKAYDKAIAILNEKKNCLVISMDVTRYYYNIDVDESMFQDIKKKYGIKDETSEAYLHDFIFEVIKRYNKLIENHESNNVFQLNDKNIFPGDLNRMMLPISFAPSSILANYYLSDFDKRIIRDTTPAFYGRYVDDFILVYEFNDKIKDKTEDKKTDNMDAVRKFLEERKIIEETNEKYRLYGTKLELNNKFVTSLYDWNYGHPNIDEVKHNLSKNKNVFSYLNDEDIEFIVNKYDVYNYDQPIDKFNKICDYQIDKYKFSVELAQIRSKLSLINSMEDVNSIKELQKILNEKVLYLNYLNIEKIVYIYLCCLEKGVDYFDHLIRHLRDLLQKMSNPKCKYSFEEYLKSSIKISFSMFNGFIVYKKYLEMQSIFTDESNDMCITSLKNEYKKASMIEDLSEKNKKQYQRYLDELKKYRHAHMFDKSIMPLYFPLVKGFIDDFDEYDGRYIRITNFNDCMELKKEWSKLKLNEEPYLPFYIHDYEKMMLYILMGYGDETNFEKVEKKLKYYKQIPGNENGTYKSWYIKVDDNNHKSKLSIGLANSNNSIILEDVFKGKRNRSMGRFNQISRVVNRAIEDDIDILVLPEVYMPFEWLLYFAKVLFKKHIALITGIEHLIIDKKVYNYVVSCLPYKINEKYTSGIIIPHLKVDYSPLELKCASPYAYTCISGKEYELINYNNLYYTMIYCYEFTNYSKRYNFYNDLDAAFIIEYNKDINYFDSIISSYVRDMHCYCIQVNDPTNGDNRITAPKNSEYSNIVKLSGGTNDVVIKGEIDISELRKFQARPQMEQYIRRIEKKDLFKMTPPNYEYTRVVDRINNAIPKGFNHK